MNWDQVVGNWKQLEGELQERLGRLFGSEDDQAAGWFERTEGMIQEHFGSIRDEMGARYEEMHSV